MRLASTNRIRTALVPPNGSPRSLQLSRRGLRHFVALLAVAIASATSACGSDDPGASSGGGDGGASSSGAGGGAPTNCPAFAPPDYGASLDVDPRLKLYLSAAGSYSETTKAIVAEVGAACASIAEAAGADASLWANAPPRELMKIA